MVYLCNRNLRHYNCLEFCTDLGDDHDNLRADHNFQSFDTVEVVMMAVVVVALEENKSVAAAARKWLNCNGQLQADNGSLLEVVASNYH